MQKRVAFMIVAVLLIAGNSFAQVRGKGRIQGVVSDEATGKPVAGAKVTVAIANKSTEPIVVETDARGRWSALGLVGGQWDVDIEAPGYVTSRGSVNVSELKMLPPIKTALTPAVATPEPAAVAPAPSVAPEVVAAINEAQDLLQVQVGDVITRTETTGAGATESISHTVTAEDVKQNSQRAATLLESAITQLPTDTPELQRTAVQLRQLLSQAYYKSGELPKAITALEHVTNADAANHGAAMLLVNLYLEAGRLDDGRGLLEKLPAGSVTDPTVYTNLGILFLNQQSPDDALTYFTKAVELDAARGESYYYRGLAYVQLKKYSEAKADLQRVVELAPASSEAEEAKALLAQMK